PLMQSEGSLQWALSRQSGQLPPQSMSDSEPLTIPSPQLAAGATQVPLAHWPLTQSAPMMQPSPSAHPGQPPPPQSAAVSVPLRTPSLQLAAAHIVAVQI